MQRSTIPNPNSNTTHQACAACKHQRKKCTQKCILAPFFPADKAKEFQAVHKVFGVSNVQKIVRGLVNEDERKRAADSLVWEAFCRQRDPILGPYGEYRRVYDELRLYKASHRNVVAPQPGLMYKGGGAGGCGGGNGLLGWKIGGGGGGQSSYFGSNGYENNVKGQEKVLSNNNHLISHQQPQEQLISGFNQQYYLSSQLSPLDVKSIESSIWEDNGS